MIARMSVFEKQTAACVKNEENDDELDEAALWKKMKRQKQK